MLDNSMRLVRHERQSGRFSKSRGLSASVFFLPLPFPSLFSRGNSLPRTPRKRLLRSPNSISKSTCKHAFAFGCLNKYNMQYCCLCYVISQIVTLALLEINLFLVITVLSQEIQTVKFGFRTSGDSILLEFVVLR